ncbi:nucleotidyl transferase AbiEii/AbiGii toxin family protein [Puteibacter caeruleilacunae]|nr:nucleotidyl transferase AbiEii/AbiGii toxin family protein [Puteibacter caeruleilacunae]
MNRFYNIPKDPKQEIYQQVSGITALAPFAVEKDWWVVQTLKILFELEVSKCLIFKGGTSLSKAWGIIERFSEDVDLAIERSFFGFDGNLNKKQRTKLRKASNEYIRKNICPALIAAFENKKLHGVEVELSEMVSSDQDPVIITVAYPNVMDTPGYIRPKIQIEIGCCSLFEPVESRAIISYVDEVFSKTPFAQESVSIPCVVPQRTFLEKGFLLHEEFHRSKEKIRVDRMSRHLYDIYKISKTEYAEKALSDKDLYETIVKHRQSFTRLGGVDYNSHQPQTIDFIPPKGYIDAWKKDYVAMQDNMIYGDSPSFEELITELEILKRKINSLEWKMQCEFPRPKTVE